MEKDCIKVARECVDCQRYTTKRYGFHPLRAITADLPMDHLAMDLAQMEASECGKIYMLIVVDICTRFTWLYPLNNKTGEEVSAKLRELFLVFGPPKRIQSDNGSEFTNLGLKVVLSGAGVDHRRVTPYNPRANGAAERTVRTVKEMLFPLIRGDLGGWVKRLPEVQYALNTSVHRRHGSTPFSLFFARSHNPLRQEPAMSQRPLNDGELQRRYELMHSSVFPAIAERTKDYNERVFNDFFKKHALLKSDIPPGALVMKQVLPRPRKSEPKWDGPYYVVRRNRGGSYVLRDATGDLLERPSPVSQLRLVSYEAVPNPDNFEIDHIVDHRGGEHSREYLIRWKGYAPKFDSWAKHEDINTLGCITEYWRERTQKREPRMRSATSGQRLGRVTRSATLASDRAGPSPRDRPRPVKRPASRDYGVSPRPSRHLR
jgi:transposase InsO family protein